MTRESKEPSEATIVWRRTHNANDAAFDTARGPQWICSFHGTRARGWMIPPHLQRCGYRSTGDPMTPCDQTVILSVELPTVIREIGEPNGEIELEIISDPQDPRLADDTFSPKAERVEKAKRVERRLG